MTRLDQGNPELDSNNKSLGETLQAFALAGDLASPSVISFNLEIAFSPEGEKTRLPITEGLGTDIR